MSVRRVVLAGLGLLALLAAYLLAWPVPIEPVAWQPPPDPGHADPFAPDPRLARLSLIDLGEHEGPEDAALGPDGRVYASTAGGRILRLPRDGGEPWVFADTGGRPLGIEFDGAGRLLVANAYSGLQRVDPDGTVELLLGEVDGQPLVYPDDVAVAADGRIFLSDATTRFSPAAHGGTYEASLLDLMEHGVSGRVIEFDPTSGRARTIADGLAFANGVAVSADQRWLLVAETGAYRVWRYPLAGGERELVIDALPGFPDNLNNGLQDRIWIGLVAPRSALLDRLAGRPFLRKVARRLPAALRPSAEPHSHVVAVTVEGEVLMNLYDEGTTLPALTGVLETRDALYLATLFGHALGRLDKRDLAPR